MHKEIKRKSSCSRGTVIRAAILIIQNAGWILPTLLSANFSYFRREVRALLCSSLYVSLQPPNNSKHNSSGFMNVCMDVRTTPLKNICSLFPHIRHRPVNVAAMRVKSQVNGGSFGNFVYSSTGNYVTIQGRSLLKRRNNN